MSKSVVYKYPIMVADEFSIEMPLGARILSVQVQKGEPFIWALVDPGCTTKVPRSFRLAGTGHDIQDPHKLRFIGTFQLAGGSLVFDLFEKPQ